MPALDPLLEERRVDLVRLVESRAAKNCGPRAQSYGLLSRTVKEIIMRKSPCGMRGTLTGHQQTLLTHGPSIVWTDSFGMRLVKRRCGRERFGSRHSPNVKSRYHWLGPASAGIV